MKYNKFDKWIIKNIRSIFWFILGFNVGMIISKMMYVRGW